MKKVVALVVVALLIGSLHSRAADLGSVDARNHGLSPEVAAAIEAIALEKMEELHSPGIAIGVVEGDQLVYEGYFGWAKIKERVPVSETTVFRIGSISKTFTAIGLMQQWEAGRFKLDDEFNAAIGEDVVRQKDPGCEPVTFLHMLTHTSGGGELMSFRQLGHLARTVGVLPGGERKPLAAIYSDGITPRVCPARKWAYCNYCFGALGYGLERLSGESFKDYTQNRVLAPIGMNDSSFYENDNIMENLAQGYAWDPAFKRYRKSAYYALAVPPMGNMYSTVPDMGRYLVALLNEGRNEHGSVLKPETLALMYQAHHQLDEKQGAMGICFIIHNDLWGARLLRHDGAVPGFYASLLFAPEEKVGLIVFGNVMSAPPAEVAVAAMRELLGREPRTEFPEPDRSIWPELAGYYGSAYPEVLSDYRFNMATNGAYRVMVEDGELMLTTLYGKKKLPLRQVEADDPYFYMIVRSDRETPGCLRFLPGPDGGIERIVVSTNAYVRLEGSALARTKARGMVLALMPRLF